VIVGLDAQRPPLRRVKLEALLHSAARKNQATWAPSKRPRWRSEAKLLPGSLRREHVEDRDRHLPLVL
jgi:hypothetical protein